MTLPSRRAAEGRVAARLGACAGGELAYGHGADAVDRAAAGHGVSGGPSVSSVRRVAVPLAGLTAAVMVVNFITARVAEAGDWLAFVLSAVVVLGLVLGLAWVGARVASRRS